MYRSPTLTKHSKINYLHIKDVSHYRRQEPVLSDQLCYCLKSDVLLLPSPLTSPFLGSDVNNRAGIVNISRSSLEILKQHQLNFLMTINTFFLNISELRNNPWAGVVPECPGQHGAEFLSSQSRKIPSSVKIKTSELHLDHSYIARKWLQKMENLSRSDGCVLGMTDWYWDVRQYSGRCHSLSSFVIIIYLSVSNIFILPPPLPISYIKLKYKKLPLGKLLGIKIISSFRQLPQITV